MIFEEDPIVELTESYKSIAKEFEISNIEENNAPRYFDTIKDSVYNTVKEFKGNDVINFKIIISSEFTSPLAFDIKDFFLQHETSENIFNE